MPAKGDGISKRKEMRISKALGVHSQELIKGDNDG